MPIPYYITKTKVCSVKKPLLTHKYCSKQLFVIQLSKQVAVSSHCCWFFREKVQDSSIFVESIPVSFSPSKIDNPDANAVYKRF